MSAANSRSITRTTFVYRSAVRVLLLSMPDSFEHTPSVAIRMPNGALASLAGNIDAHHEVAIADLILVQSAVQQTVERLVRETTPDIVGLSVMTFQRSTARRIVSLIRSLAAANRDRRRRYDRAWHRRRGRSALGIDASSAARVR